MATVKMYVKWPDDNFESGVSGVPTITRTGVLVTSAKATSVETAARAYGITVATGTPPTPTPQANPNYATIGDIATETTRAETAEGKLAILASTLGVVGSTYTPHVASARTVVRIAAPSANFTVANPTGTPGDGDSLIVRINSGATVHTATWGTAYKSSGIATKTTPLVATKTVTFGYIYSASASKWILLALDAVGY